MYDQCTITCETASATAKAGESLAATVYDGPLTVALVGELGAGKTTFLRGFLAALGAATAAVSPTYALEQRYATDKGEVLHVDLYRLDARDARRLLQSTADHPGIRAVEWHDRAEVGGDEPRIDLRFRELDRDTRAIEAEFRDAPLPPEGFAAEMREAVRLPTHIARHCDAVAAFAGRLADLLVARGRFVRKQALVQAGLVHDLFRFLDFRPGAHPAGFAPDAESERTWARWREAYPRLRHEPACARFLEERGYATHAAIVAVHGLVLPAPERTTVEQKLLYYADKRVREDEVVTLDERFADFAKRYRGGKETTEAAHWHAEARRIEAELFPEGAPAS